MKRNHGLKICQSCGNEFTASQHNQKYCGSQLETGTCAFKEKRIITRVYQKSKRVPLKANCLKCGEEFQPYNTRQVLCGSRKHKTGCSYIGVKKYKKDNRRKGTLRKYNLTEEQYTEMSKKQDNKCYICKQNSVKFLCVDHCHTTGKVRDLLCHNCNTAIGHFKESKELLLSAINYLEKWN